MPSTGGGTLGASIISAFRPCLGEEERRWQLRKAEALVEPVCRNTGSARVVPTCHFYDEQEIEHEHKKIHEPSLSPSSGALAGLLQLRRENALASRQQRQTLLHLLLPGLLIVAHF